MIKVHHLGASRSDRIIWLCEELDLDYQLVLHERNPETMRSPDSIWAINPLGKAPVIEDGYNAIFESGAIIEYLVETYGSSRLKPQAGTQAYIRYLHWMHASESTLMTPILFNILCSAMGVESELLPMFMEGECKTLFSYIADELDGHDYITGDEFSAADIMVVYTLMMAENAPVGADFQAAGGADHKNPFEDYPAIGAYLARIQSRPAYQRAAEKF